jgi:tRNA A58 N-methylase Trm61
MKSKKNSRKKFMINILRRYTRYLLFIFRIYIYEKPRGLDFYARDLTLCKNTNSRYHGYSVTPVSFLKTIFSALEISKFSNFLDIGCGKGFVLTYAAKYPFNNIAGFDVSSDLVQIAKNNISLLNLQHRISIFKADALTYNTYEKFDCFFLFNPFPSEIMKPTINKIIESMSISPREITVIYYNPVCHEHFMETGHFKVVCKLYDNVKDYNAYIYKSI